MRGLYVYCVGAKLTCGSRLKQDTVPVGDRTRDLAVVPYRDVEAIVGKVSLHEFEGDAVRKHLEDAQWLKENVLAHEQIVEEVMQRNPPIVPFKFGTVFRNRERLQHMLKAHYARFQTLLAHFQGKQEFGIKLFSNIQTLRRSIQQDNQAFTRFAKKIQKQPPGKKYFLEQELKTQLDTMVKETQAKRVAACTVMLSPLVCEVVQNDVMPRTVTGRDEEMVLHLALLAEEAQRDALRQRVKEWNSAHQQEGFTLELTGPWPPYHFATL